MPSQPRMLCIEHDRVIVRSRPECTLKMSAHRLWDATFPPPTTLLPNVDEVLWRKFVAAYNHKEPLNACRKRLYVLWRGYGAIAVVTLVMSCLAKQHQHLPEIVVALIIVPLALVVFQSFWYRHALERFYDAIVSEFAPRFRESGVTLTLEHTTIHNETMSYLVFEPTSAPIVDTPRTARVLLCCHPPDSPQVHARPLDDDDHYSDDDDDGFLDDDQNDELPAAVRAEISIAERVSLPPVVTCNGQRIHSLTVHRV